MTLTLLDMLGGAGSTPVVPYTGGPGVPLWLVLLDGAGSPMAEIPNERHPQWSRRYMTRRLGR